MPKDGWNTLRIILTIHTLLSYQTKFDRDKNLIKSGQVRSFDIAVIALIKL